MLSRNKKISMQRIIKLSKNVTKIVRLINRNFKTSNTYICMRPFIIINLFRIFYGAHTLNDVR